MWNGIFSFLTFYCILEFLFPLYRAYDRHTTLFFSIQWARFPNTIYQMTYHFLLVLKYQPCYISGPPGPSPGLHILIYFLFSICLLLWQKDTKNAMVLTLVSELREGASSQCLFTTLLGTHTALSSVKHREVLDRHHRQEERPKSQVIRGDWQILVTSNIPALRLINAVDFNDKEYFSWGVSPNDLVNQALLE